MRILSKPNFVVIVTLLLAVIPLSTIDLEKTAQAQSCRSTYQQDRSRYRNRTGPLALNNLTDDRSVTVTLYHPDSQRPNGTWTIPPGQNLWVPAANYIIADDWGISFTGGRCIQYVGEVTEYTNGHYAVYAEYVSPEGFGLDDIFVIRPRRSR